MSFLWSNLVNLHLVIIIYAVIESVVIDILAYIFERIVKFTSWAAIFNSAVI